MFGFPTRLLVTVMRQSPMATHVRIVATLMTDNTSTIATCVFLDTETTSLNESRRPWNIGLITRKPDGTETEEEIIIGEMDLSLADPRALEIGHFWDRHPIFGDDRPGDHVWIIDDEEAAACWLIERIAPTKSGNVHIIGCVPSFDVQTLTAMMHRQGLCWPAHYHIIDAEAVAIGALAARGIRTPLPYTGEWLTEQLGLDTSKYEAGKHTALGDARWARDLYDAATRPITAP